MSYPIKKGFNSLLLAVMLCWLWFSKFVRLGKEKLMMQEVTKKSKKKAPIICATVVIAFLGVFLATILFPLIGEIYGELMAVGFLVIYGLMIIAVIIGVFVALCQRLKEIEGGEEEDAKKY